MRKKYSYQTSFEITNNNLHGSNTFCINNNHATHNSFNKTGTIHQIDHALIDIILREYVECSRADGVNGVSSDHC